jgi:hypothetical protein
VAHLSVSGVAQFSISLVTSLRLMHELVAQPHRESAKTMPFTHWHGLYPNPVLSLSQQEQINKMMIFPDPRATGSNHYDHHPGTGIKISGRSSS